MSGLFQKIRLAACDHVRHANAVASSSRLRSSRFCRVTITVKTPPQTACWLPDSAPCLSGGGWGGGGGAGHKPHDFLVVLIHPDEASSYGSSVPLCRLFRMGEALRRFLRRMTALPPESVWALGSASVGKQEFDHEAIAKRAADIQSKPHPGLRSIPGHVGSGQRRAASKNRSNGNRGRSRPPLQRASAVRAGLAGVEQDRHRGIAFTRRRSPEPRMPRSSQNVAPRERRSLAVRTS